MTASPEKAMLCALRHTLRDGESGRRFDFCTFCHDLSDSKVAIKMHCPRCCESVCEKCLADYRDIGFAMFLNQEDRSSLCAYKENPACAMHLVRNPWGAQVYALHEEYNDTAVFREMVKKQIKKAEKRVEELKCKLAASEERAICAQIEATNIRA